MMIGVRKCVPNLGWEMFPSFKDQFYDHIMFIGNMGFVGKVLLIEVSQQEYKTRISG